MVPKTIWRIIKNRGAENLLTAPRFKLSHEKFTIGLLGKSTCCAYQHNVSVACFKKVTPFLKFILKAKCHAGKAYHKRSFVALASSPLPEKILPLRVIHGKNRTLINRTLWY